MYVNLLFNKEKNNIGQTMVEMALVFPIILFVLMGIIEFGRIFTAYMIVINASREGARIAAVGGSDADVVNSVRNASVMLDYSNLNVNVYPEETSRTRGMSVSVSVRYDLPLIVPIMNVILPDPFPISSQTTMRVE